MGKKLRARLKRKRRNRWEDRKKSEVRERIKKGIKKK